MLQLRCLTSDDIPAWFDIREEMLRLHPTSFGISLSNDLQERQAFYSTWLQNGTVFGVVDDTGRLHGVAGFFQDKAPLKAHRGTLFSMFVRPEARRQGWGDQLVKAVLAHARAHVQQIHLSVVTTQEPAIALYKSNGFQITGTDTRALKLGDTYYDDFLMMQVLS